MAVDRPPGLPLVRGAAGPAVRDLQQRLVGAGFVVDDEASRFDAGTEAALRRFQEHRRLVVDGICGQDTWSALVEAGYRLGDRLLYLRRPMLRGDDVAELQHALGSLGFDAGRVDGIFGPDTEHALRDFQRNAALTMDGVCGPDVLAALSRLGSRTRAPHSVAGLREREALEQGSRQLATRRIAVGEPGGLDGLVVALGRSLREAGATVLTLHHPDASQQAAAANEFGADAFVAVAVADAPACRAAFYAAPGFESVGGRRLAELLAEHLAPVFAPPDRQCLVEGMRSAILRETRMPAVSCTLGPPPEVVARSADLAAIITQAVQRWVEAPVASG